MLPSVRQHCHHPTLIFFKSGTHCSNSTLRLSNSPFICFFCFFYPPLISLPLSPLLLLLSSFVFIFFFFPSISILSGDCVALVTQARAEASEYRYNYGYNMPCRILAARMADLAQVYTQHAGRRAYAGMMILCSVDDEAGPQLYKVDPAGHFFGFKAVAAGPKYLESTTRLEKCIKEDGIEHDSENTIRNLIMQLQAVLSTDFKSSEIEIAVVELNEKFRTLSEEEIDEHLTAIAERD